MALPADLHDRAVRSGRDWAQSLSAELLRDGRPLEGGFPGTLSEALTWALGAFVPEDCSGPVRTEIARVVYASARKGWMASCRLR